MNDPYIPKTTWVNGVHPYPMTLGVIVKSEKVRWSWQDCAKVVKQHPGCTTLFIAKKLQGVQDKSVRVMLDARIRHGDVYKMKWFNPRTRRHQIIWYYGKAPDILQHKESEQCH